MIRVLIADDHKMVRDGLKRILAGSELEVAAEAASAGSPAARSCSEVRSIFTAVSSCPSSSCSSRAMRVFSSSRASSTAADRSRSSCCWRRSASSACLRSVMSRRITV